MLPHPENPWKPSIVALQASDQHAEFIKEDGHHYVQDLGTPSGTWLNDRKLPSGARQRLRPGDVLEFGAQGTGLKYKIKWATTPLSFVSSSVALLLWPILCVTLRVAVGSILSKYVISCPKSRQLRYRASLLARCTISCCSCRLPLPTAAADYRF